MPDRISMDNKMNELYIELEQAKKFTINNQLEKALEILQVLLKKYPRQECIIFEIGKIYIIKNRYQMGIEYLEKIKTSEEYKGLVFDLLIYSYKMLNKDSDIFEIYKLMVQRNIRINKNKIKIILGTIKKLKKYYECSIKFFKQDIEKDDIKQFYFDYLNDTLQSLNIEENFNTKLKIYKNFLNKLKTDKLLLIEIGIFYKISETIYGCLIGYVENLNLLNDTQKIKRIYFEIKSFIHKEYKKMRNILLNEYEISNRKFILKSFPRIIELGLTNKCNLRCIMCSEHNHIGNKILSDKIVDDLIKIVPYLQKLTLRGGEVFLDG